VSTTTLSSAGSPHDERRGRTPSFPFCDLLDTLRQKHFAIGLSDYQAVVRLIERWDGADVFELRSAIAALLATSADEIPVILETFDALYVTEEPEERISVKTSPKWFDRARRRLRAWHVGAAAALVLLGVIAFRAFLPPPPVPSTDQPPQVIEPLPLPVPDRPPSPPPSLPAPPVTRDTALLPLLTAFAGVLVGSGAWALRTRKAQTSSIRRAWRQVLATLRGPFYYDASIVSVLSPVMRKAVGDAATILGRRFAESIPSDELDVDASLAMTLRAGLRPVLVFTTPPMPSPIVILRDLGSEMRVWNRKIDALIDQLEVSGVLVENWYFEEDATFVSRTPHGRVVSLESLANRHDGSALFVISTGAGVPLALDRPGRAWVRLLAEWEDRAWLTPINHPLYWRPELRKPGMLPLPVYPMTRVGLVAAARALTGGDIKSEVRPSVDVRSVSADDIERMKRLVALVPYPTLELAERLRQRFCPTVPEEVLLFLADETESRSSHTIRFADTEIRRLVADQRRDAPDQELEVRRFLRQILEASEPPASSVAHLRWELDRAIQQLHLSMLAPNEEQPPTSTLERLADGPLGEEVRSAVSVAAAASGPRVRQPIRKIQARRWALPSGSAEREAPPEFRWTWPGVVEPVVGVAAASIAYLALVAWGPFPSHVVEHRLDVYALEWVAPTSPNQPGSLIGRRLASDSDASIPPSPDLYRDGVRVGSVTGLTTASSRSVSTIPPDRTGAYYQLRATLPPGNLAVSNAVFLPGPRIADKVPEPATNVNTPVVITIDLQPWARVRIVRQDTSPSSAGDLALPSDPLLTPFTISLPPGDYTLQCENGGITASLTLPLRVEGGQSQIVSRAMPGFNPNQVVDTLLGQRARQ